ncbi:MAG: hypothetical protein M3178_02505 [Pseudomonadota bacterium]|nr:hypothetical protein [Pseudomonadota bacterium]
MTWDAVAHVDGVFARAFLTRRRADLDKGAELLLTKEAITAEEFLPIQKMEPPKTPVSPPVVKV